MIMSLMTILLSLATVSLVAVLSRISARLRGQNLSEAALLSAAMKGATMATIAAMYAAYRLTDGGGKRLAAILAISAGLLVILVIWEKRRRLLSPRRASETGAT